MQSTGEKAPHVSLRDRAGELARLVTSPIRPLPDFLIVGAMKCGTTSLYHDLLRHPEVIGATRKEVHFFDPAKFAKGPRWYRAQFPSTPYRQLHRLVRGPNTVTGDASPSYLLYPHAPRQAAALVPAAKIIVLLRDPVDRAHSQFHHQRRHGVEPLPTFEEALDAEEGRLAGEWERLVTDPTYISFAMKKFSYVLRSVYLPQLERWQAVFPRDQILVAHSADYDADPASVARRVAGFLGLSPWEPPTAKRNVGGYDDRIAPATRARLNEVFRPHNRALFENLGTDFGWPS